MDPVLASKLDALTAASNDLRRTATPEGDIPDAAGRVRSVETDLQTWRLDLTRELGPGVTKGTEYQVVAGYTNHRNYNVAAILSDLAAEDDLFTTLISLIDRDVIRVQVQWTNLQNEFQGRGVTMRVAHRELMPEDMGDLEAPHVGTWRKETAPKVEGIKD